MTKRLQQYGRRGCCRSSLAYRTFALVAGATTRRPDRREVLTSHVLSPLGPQFLGNAWAAAILPEDIAVRVKRAPELVVEWNHVVKGVIDQIAWEDTFLQLSGAPQVWRATESQLSPRLRLHNLAYDQWGTGLGHAPQDTSKTPWASSYTFVCIRTRELPRFEPGGGDRRQPYCYTEGRYLYQ